MNQRRDRLNDLQLSSIENASGTHAGLWLDRYFEVLGDGKGAEAAWAKEVVTSNLIRRASLYKSFFKDRWQPVLEALGTQLDEFELGRFALGLGEPSVLDVGFTLHHTYGVPYLTGSALKGLTAACARHDLGGSGNKGDERWRKGGELYRHLFGDTEWAGIVEFEDALPLPNKWELHPAVMTPHHKKYYNGGKPPASAPADWDDPIPVSFLTASGTFLVALRGPQDWCALALHILCRGLEREGIGAKTSSGFGRLKFEEQTA